MKPPPSIENSQLLLSLKDVTELLVQRLSPSEGMWDLSLEFQVGVGALGATVDQRMPGAMVAVSRIGISKVETAGPYTVIVGDPKQR